MAHSVVLPAAATVPASPRSVREPAIALLVIFTVALAARLVPTLRGSGLLGLHFYDDGVHYAAATGLVHGRLPYRDFLLLHPPGIVVLLAPFAALGRLVGDAHGFALARLAFMLLGAVNALLVSRYLRGVGVFAAWFGGLFYALFWPAIYSEHTVLLEAPANTCLLVALLLLTPREGSPGTARLVTAGALLGLAMTVKIWGVVPLLVVCGWILVRLGWRASARLLLGAAAAAIVVCLPFFLAAPRTMWRMVVVDQVERPDTALTVVHRLNEIVGLTLYRPPDQATLLLVLTCVVIGSSAVAAAFHPRGRLVSLLLVALVTLLLLTPSWFVHYTALTAPVVALVVGVGAQLVVSASWRLRRSSPRSRSVPAAVTISLALALAAFAAPVATDSIGRQFPGPVLEAAVARRPGCVTSDHPSALILMNVLSRNLERHCPLVVDLGGAAYDLPSPGRGQVSRRKNPVWQRYAMKYLRSGDTVILARFYAGYGFSRRYYKEVWTWNTLLRVDRFTLRAPRR